MVSFLSSWTKSLCLALIVVSILEILIPNNKTKKYIKMVMGLYILFSIISPFIKNSGKFDLNNININQYLENTIDTDIQVVDQTSMDKRLTEIYIQELEKDITQKIQEKGYMVNKCKVNANISKDSQNSGINKIILKLRKEVEKKQSIEEKLVTEIQKIQQVNINIDNKDNTESELDKTDIENIKKFLVQEYGVSEKCLLIS